MKIGELEHILCDVVASPLPECIIGMDIMSDRGLLALPNAIKQKGCKPILRPVLIGQVKWEALELPEPTQVVNLKQYRPPGGQKEITTLVSHMLEAGVLVSMNSLYSSPVWLVKKADGLWRLTVD